MISGVSPRSLILGVSLNSVLFWIFKPATFPVKDVVTSTVFAKGRLSPFTFWTAYPRAFSSRLIPKAVTTTSSNLRESSSRVILNISLCPTAIFLVTYPIKEMTNVALSGTSKLNFPSISEIVPFVVPLWMTLAPGTGSPFPSVTTPVIFLLFCWATSTSLGERIILLSKTL